MKRLIKKILREDEDPWEWVKNANSFDGITEDDRFLMKFGPHPLPHISNQTLRIKMSTVGDNGNTKTFKLQSLQGGKWICCLEISRDEWDGFIDKGIVRMDNGLTESENPWEWVNDAPDYVDVSNLEIGDIVRIEVIGDAEGVNGTQYGVNPHVFDNQVGEVLVKTYSDSGELFVHIGNWENQPWGDIYFGSDDVRMGSHIRYHVLDRKNINESEGFKDSSEEDWEWAKDVPTGELGEYFNEDDVAYDEEDEDVKVNLFSNRVVYNLSKGEFEDWVNDGYDDWVLDTLINTNGNVQGGDVDGHLDSDEINYIGYSIPNESIARLQKILDNPKVLKKIREKLGEYQRKFTQTDLFNNKSDWVIRREKQDFETVFDMFFKDEPKGGINVSTYVENQTFSELEWFVNTIYTGRYGWDDFSDESLWAIEGAIDTNRWIMMNNEYNTLLEDNDMEIESSGGYYGDSKIKITIPFPFNDIYNLSDILSSLDISDRNWQDWFYDEYSQEGSEDAVEEHFNNMLDVLEEAVEDEDF
jgi:hypothetical protein